MAYLSTDLASLIDSAGLNAAIHPPNASTTMMETGFASLAVPMSTSAGQPVHPKAPSAAGLGKVTALRMRTAAVARAARKARSASRTGMTWSVSAVGAKARRLAERPCLLLG